MHETSDGQCEGGLVASCFNCIHLRRGVFSTDIGRTEQITLLDQIHLLAMLYIFGIALASIHAQTLHDRGAETEASRWDRRGLWITSFSYVILNVLLFTVAVFRG